MSIAAAQASKFYEQVVREGKVFTFIVKGDFPVFRNRSVEVVPFWSSRSGISEIHEHHAEFAPYVIDEITFADFREKTLKQLEEEGICVGLNWTGEKLTGYDLPVSELRECLAAQIAQQGKVT